VVDAGAGPARHLDFNGEGEERAIANPAFAIWRRLPVRPRQQFARALIGLLRPRLAGGGGPPPADWPVVIVGFLSSPSGLGQAARLAAAAFAREGVSVFGVDLGRHFFEGGGAIDHGIAAGGRLVGPAHVIININAPYLPYALWLLGRRFLRDKHLTGYWAWELPNVPPSWSRGYRCVHDIAVPSRFVASAVAARSAGRPVMVAPHPVALDPPPPAVRRQGAPYSPAQPFTVMSVLNVASGFERKNPLALITAFRQAFGNDPSARLRLSVVNADHFPPAGSAITKAVAGQANIEVNWHSMDRDAFRAWWGTPDLYASLHRAEGFGLPLAEAMCAGYPVLATGWSGNLEFMTEDNAFLVGYRLADIKDPQAKYSPAEGQWAEPDIDHAARLMRQIRGEPALAADRAERARMDIITRCDSASFCRAIRSAAAGGWAR